ncbi:ectoine hydroxylase [Achromobacter spanius]|jgi:ectoine hydroxylase|uniref:Ectoine hydroxylase n=1 Tax=Achromobacter spanius TaxID=217203 RepID=A0AA42LT41_9BURK|nr:ectoine hydroxylase [Achromobacter spanius]SPT40856.1 ectoine hydroxylase [Achromobacter denitrificans]AUA57129.1 ectoine hydroxylase [Achromobacter spanius]MDH0739036.1 ectoine hydroxylase [Achromobacter spanius]CAB3701838.1 Ectoine dioxygenase [Achromobacter spanius]VEE55199.1 ectoine hydroxylase [Achromobacter spanius]
MISPAQDPYASRTDRGSAIIARQDPVVYEDGKYANALSGEQVGQYERDGFLLMENLFSEEEIRALSAEVERMTRDPSIIRREESITEPGSNAVRSIFMVHVLNPVLSRLVRDPRLVNVARQILGSEVYIHQSRANMKPGFKGKEFYWHSDFETWHVEDGMPSMRALSCSVLLTDNNECNGPLMLVPGSHRQFISCVGETPNEHYKQSLKKQEYGVPDPVSLQLLVEQGGIRSMTAKAGSVVFFDCNTMHGSNSNISPWPRANVFMVYNSMENTLNPPKYGLTPRPEHIATRKGFKAVTPLDTLKLVGG